MVTVRSLTDADEPAAEGLVDLVLGGRLQARMGEVIDVLALPALGAWEGDALVGVTSYAIDGTTAEIALLGVEPTRQGAGIGSALLDAALAELGRRGVERVWLVTTNDNVTALVVYQRKGFRLVEVRAGAIDRARAQKPTIPEIGRHGIPMRDELVLERHLAAPGA